MHYLWKYHYKQFQWNMNKKVLYVSFFVYLLPKSAIQ